MTDAGRDASSTARDGGAARIDAGHDAGDAGDAGPIGTCEGVLSDPDAPRGCTTAGELQHCVLERCCQLAVGCDEDHRLAPGAWREGAFVLGELFCDTDPVQPECVLSSPNATLTGTIEGRPVNLLYAYVEHGVGFGTYAGITFTADGTANVCADVRLTVPVFGPAVDLSGDDYYVGVYELQVAVFDSRGTPGWRFPTAVLRITESLGFREGGPLTGSIEINDDAVRLSGTFTSAAECAPWRTSGS
ncbi:MAG TPA: hypothetical protein ENK57_06815 [Polyangiaceae bacterium]|nr:hypothetical protein [Polyangiaceae bacterium]